MGGSLAGEATTVAGSSLTRRARSLDRCQPLSDKLHGRDGWLRPRREVSALHCSLATSRVECVVRAAPRSRLSGATVESASVAAA